MIIDLGIVIYVVVFVVINCAYKLYRGEYAFFYLTDLVDTNISLFIHEF